jgi:hypothetical protein
LLAKLFQEGLEMGAIGVTIAVIIAALLSATANAEHRGSPTGTPGLNEIEIIDGRYDAMNFYFDVYFTPGTLDATNLGFGLGLDTDLDPNTGVVCDGYVFFPCGAEWSFYFNSQRDASNAFLSQSDAPFPVEFGSDHVSLTVPLDPNPELGLPDDGYALYGLVTGVPLSPDSIEALDVAPTSAVFGPLGGPTTWRGDIAIAVDDGVDYTDRILVITGRSKGFETRCGIETETFKAVAIDVNGGPAVVTEVGFASGDLNSMGPAKRYTTLGSYPCANPNFIELQIAPQ